MPTLDWIGKKAVLNHHREVPYKLLKCDSRLSVGDPGSGNLLVEGDNLVALKALLPYYAGQVKCIYIDPPYNTGNERWMYNDNVNSPEIRDWLGKVVKGEDEDLSRHDKWLCMMLPRLNLLREFLRQDGVILVSIDDFEGYRLRSLLDEVFGPRNFIAQLVWDKTRKNDAKLFSVGHEYLLVYARSLSYLRNQRTIWREQKPGARDIISEWRKLKRIHGEDCAAIQHALRAWYASLPKGHPSKKLSRYKWVDRYGPWRDRDISWPGGGGPRYDVLHEKTKLPCKVPERGWGFATPEAMKRQIELGLIQFRADHTEPPIRKAHLMPVPEELDEGSASDPDDAEETEEVGLQVMPSVIQKQAQVAVKMLRKMFDGEKAFPNPKDHEVIMRFIRYVTGPNDLILDSFAGSGVTGHAVLQINKEDGSNRRFILVELDSSIAGAITRQRLKKVIEGYGDIEACGSGVRYCKLGESLFDQDGRLCREVTYTELAQHVFFVETGEPLSNRASGKDSPLIGIYNGTAYYLLFNGILGDRRPASGNVLTGEVLSRLPKHDGPRVVYGEGCRLGTARLNRERITFKQIPYGIVVD